MLRKILSNPLPGEKAVTLIRKHWLTFVAEILIRLMFAVVPPLLFLSFYLYGIDYSLKFGNPNYGLLWMIIGMYYAALMLSLYAAWVDFSLDVWLLTNQRVVHVEQKGLFSRVIVEHRLDRIQNVESHVAGFIRTILNYGDVIIQTASEDTGFKFKGIPKPSNIVRQIVDLQHQVMSQAGVENKEKKVEINNSKSSNKSRQKEGL